MEDLVKRLEKLLPSRQELEKSDMQKAYAKGVTDSIKAVHESVASNLYMNGIYYVIMYMNGDVNLPYVAKMRLVRSNHTKKGESFSFTKQLDWSAKAKTDLVLYSKKEITRRVFSSYEQAAKVIAI